MSRRLRRRVTLVLLRGGGRPTFSVRLPVPSLATLPLSGLCAVAFCIFLGWQMHGTYGLRGNQAMVVRLGQHDTQHWSMFQLAAPVRRQQTPEQLRRRAALMHALKLGLGTKRTATQLLAGVVAPEWRAAAEKGPAADGTLLWPVAEGWFVRGYGSGEGGYHLAVDVMGERGADVRAAAPGVIGYAGSAVRGFGNMVMIVHPGGWVTLYAHNDRNHVVAGQRVKRGQLIADLGNTGISRGPHVHFELMHEGRNCDPLGLFRPGVRHRPGHLGAVEQVVWEPGGSRPHAVRCAPRRRHPRSRYVDHEHASVPAGASDAPTGQSDPPKDRGVNLATL